MSIATSSNGATVTVTWPCDGPVRSDEPCRWSEMHHYDDEGRHWCPTGYVFCHTHGGVGTIDGPATCQLWGEFPNRDG